MIRQCYGSVRWSGAAMRCYRATLLVMLTVAGITSAGRANARAEGTTDEVKAMLENTDFQEALRASKGIDAKHTPVVYLVLNHETLEWSVYHSKPRKHEKTRGGEAPPAIVTIDDDNSKAKLLGPDGNARVVRSEDEKLVLIVEKANPFLYSYDGTVSAPQESSDAAAMRSALSAIGNAISGILGTLRDRTPGEQDQVLGPFRKRLRALQGLVNTRDKVQLYVRTLETGVGSIANAPTLKEVSDTAKAGLQALSDSEILAQSWALGRCFQIWCPLLRLWDLLSIEDGELTAARAEMVKTRVTIETCSDNDSHCADEVKKAFQALGDLHLKKPEERPDALSKILRNNLDAWKAFELHEVLSAKKDFLGAAAQLEAFVRLGKSQALCLETDNDWAWPLAGMVAVMAPPFPDQTWLQDNPGGISIKSETSVCPDCVRLRRIDVDKKFLLISRRQGFLGVGFGVTFTNLTDPTFSAVSQNNTSSQTPPQSTSQIVRTANESRSGIIVAMLFLRLRPAFNRAAQPSCLEPGVEFGAGLDPKKWGFYAGPSVEIKRYVRIGFGATLQSINRLGDGLTFSSYDKDGLPDNKGTVLTGLNSFEVKKKSKVGWYFGLTFAFDALPLFSPSK